MDAPADQPGFVLVVWCEVEFSWASICIGADRAPIAGLHARLAAYASGEFRVLAVPSMDDDTVERVGAREPWPDHVSYLRHERYGVS